MGPCLRGKGTRVVPVWEEKKGGRLRFVVLILVVWVSGDAGVCGSGQWPRAVLPRPLAGGTWSRLSLLTFCCMVEGGATLHTWTCVHFVCMLLCVLYISSLCMNVYVIVIVTVCV